MSPRGMVNCHILKLKQTNCLHGPLSLPSHMILQRKLKGQPLRREIFRVFLSTATMWVPICVSWVSFSPHFLITWCLVSVCLCAAGGGWGMGDWHEGQKDMRSRWHRGGCCRVGGWGLVSVALSRSTCHLPRPAATASRWQKKQQRHGGRKLCCYVRKPTEHLLIFTTVLRLVLTAEAALENLATALVVNYTTAIRAW